MLEPQDAREAYHRGLEYLDYNEPDHAIAAFTEAIRLSPRHSHAYFARGCAWSERGNPQQAIADYSRAIELDPAYAAAYYNRAAAHRAQGNPAQAEKDMARYAQLLEKASDLKEESPMPIEVRKPTPQEVARMKACPTWEKEPSEFPWHYDEQETCLILEGQATVESPDQRVTFGPGDYVVFPVGLDCTWKVTKPLRKHYKFG